MVGFVINWIKAELDTNPDKTRSGLARALGIDRSAVTRLMDGKRQLKFNEAHKAATYLGAEPPSGFFEEGEAFTPAPGPALAPLYSVKSERDGFWLLDRRGPPVDRKPKAPAFAGAAGVFGFYAPDDAMAPRFKTGEIVWVDPARPVTPRGDILLVRKGAAKGKETVILCELLDAQETEWLIVQHTTAEPQYLPHKDWLALHVLPRF